MNKYFYRLLLAILVLGSASGVHSQERPHNPAVKEHKSVAVPVWQVPDTQGNAPSAARQMESPKPIPPMNPTVIDKIPPKKIGDLSCPQVDDAAREACNNTCKNNFPQTPCSLLCTYRKNDERQCVLWTECTTCAEIPGQVQTPSGR
jgi:hypothetical protein